LIPLSLGERAERLDVAPQGMRASLTGRVTFDGLAVSSSSVIGNPGDYIREPVFSGGAWRTSAVTLGGLEALVGEAQRQLIARARHNDPYQQARIGEMLIAQETAYLWTREAALIAEGSALALSGDTTGYVNLARIAVEAATLDAMRLVQRSLGLAGFLPPNPVERILRDLATYLRQPAPDEALTEAAGWFTANRLTDLPRPILPRQ
jgi:alkylation response protein AidB-like acyl-CoA dehydrogenase